MLVTGIWGIICFILGIAIGIEFHYLLACRKREKEIEELRERLRAAEDERDGWRDSLESTDKLLRAATDRADRLAAMNQGLTEDLAALKAYDPDEIEEKLRKIQELRAAEEREELVRRMAQLNLSLLMSQPWGWSGAYSMMDGSAHLYADGRRVL